MAKQATQTVVERSDSFVVAVSFYWQFWDIVYRVWKTVFVFMALSIALFAQSQDREKNAGRPFVVIEEPGAPGRIDAKKLDQCLGMMVRELGLEGRELPPMVIYHLSEKSAHFLGVDSSMMYVNRGSGRLRYEMWIIGKPSNLAYSYAIENILTHEFAISMPASNREQLLRRAAEWLNATVDAKSFR